MPLNPNHIVIVFDKAEVKEVYSGNKRKIYGGGAHFDKTWIKKWASMAIVLKQNICNQIIIGRSNQKARFQFGTESFIVNLHHISRIYEEETNTILWQKKDIVHIIIQFDAQVMLCEAPTSSGLGIFFDIHKYIDINWIEQCNGRLWQNQLMMLKPICEARATTNEVIISVNGEEIGIPKSFLVEVYEKETAKKIWQRPVV